MSQEYARCAFCSKVRAITDLDDAMICNPEFDCDPNEPPARQQPLRDAATALRNGAELTPEAREAIATWLDAEAVVIGEMEPFADLINAAVKHKTGVETLIQFGRKEDGSMAMHADTSQAAFAVAKLVLE